MFLRCFAGVALTEAEYVFLAELPQAQYQLPHRVTCDLEHGHDSDHIAFCQSIGADEEAAWWITWNSDRRMRSLVELPFCCDDCIAADACLLPDGHPGRHSFELTTLLVPPSDLDLLRPVRSSTP
ncbi:hypothetical protein Cs7R123_46140 [Catellatospora sp. TT07R-123]|uniref:hypothetical protein n=1 Tax=Catellatospora sp. TT07R-123 TaxID=2733863 RepID=UPI001B2F4395|nr:hypothetical protein [Catellatospora sp. TT07R-123]GHJ47272.1 hypothetical protein Cs7R123_46140 [Catellatospora sp. TT07R-123]